jgi:hypothetical protein
MGGFWMCRFKFFVLLSGLLLITSCFRQAPQEPTSTPGKEAPLITDSQIDRAIKDEGRATTLESSVDDSEPVNVDAGIENLEPTPSELIPQAVLPGGQGFVVYGWYSASDATTPWRVYLHNEITDAATMIYGGLREINSVAVSGDGTKFLVSMRDTTDITSDFEIFQITLNPTTVTKLTNNTKQDTNVSMAANASKYVWETDNFTTGVRNVVLRDNSVSPVTTTTLAPSINQTQPKITNDGKFIALMRRATTGVYES